MPIAEANSQAAVGAPTPAASRQRACAESGIPYTPQFVVDWLYQALLDTVRALETALEHVSYNASGHPEGDGHGQVVLFWGSHLGSLRDQALIAWDYDVEYACFQHSAHKYRIAPKSPAAWDPYRELYQEICQETPGLGRAQLTTITASRWRQGFRAKQPHGSNCIDIETYCVQPNSALNLLASKPCRMLLDQLFPTAVGVFGPLLFSIPRTPAMLFHEYGEDCMQQRQAKVKKRSRTTWTTVPSYHRRAVWPTTSLRNANGYLC